MNSTITKTANFLKNSSKRQLFLEKDLDKRTTSAKVKDLCRTRWVYRHEAYEKFYLLYKYLVDVMKAISEQDSSYGDMSWDSKTRVAANGLSKLYHSFTFITSFIITMNVMSVIRPISVKLQHRSYDIVKAYNKVKCVIEALWKLRSSDAMLHSWYSQAKDLADSIGVVSEVPRTAGHQQHRDNVEHNSVEEYFRRTVILPLLDHLIIQMEERFGNTQLLVAKLINLVPAIIVQQKDLSFHEVVSFYSTDLPNPALITTEVWRWREKWSGLIAVSSIFFGLILLLILHVIECIELCFDCTHILLFYTHFCLACINIIIIIYIIPTFWHSLLYKALLHDRPSLPILVMLLDISEVVKKKKQCTEPVQSHLSTVYHRL